MATAIDSLKPLVPLQDKVHLPTHLVAQSTIGKPNLFRQFLLRLKMKLKEYPSIVYHHKKIKRFAFQTITQTDYYLRRKYDKTLSSNFELDLIMKPSKLRINEIEINKNCNLNCEMCKTQLSTRKQENMSLKLFEQIMDMMRTTDHSTPIPLHTIGEPLINPLLEEYLKIAKKYKKRIYLSTNGQTLDKKMDLIFRFASTIEILRFSVDGATKETYEKIRVPGKFDRLITNLELFKKENKDGKYIKDTEMSSIVSTDVQDQLAYHLEFYGRYVPMTNINLGLVTGLAPDNSYFMNHTILKNHIKLNRPCKQLGGPVQILADGRISACCRDYNGDLIYGSIKNNSLDKIINSPEAVKLRSYHVDNKIPENILCASCFMIDRRVTRLFELFAKALVLRHRKRWNVEKMQKRFDLFFDLFKERIPPIEAYLGLMT